MRRSKAPDQVPAPQLGLAPAPAPASPRRAETDARSEDDVARGSMFAVLAAIGRLELTLDLLERRLGRIEATVGQLTENAGDVPQD